MRLIIVGLALGLAVAVGSAGGASYSSLPPVVERILDRDWCRPSSYLAARQAAARVHVKLSRVGENNLSLGEQAARRDPAGCRLATRSTPSRHPRMPPSHAPWIQSGLHGDPCPHGALPLGASWRRPAAVAALLLEGRSERPILTGEAPASAPTALRGPQVVGACGRVAAARSVAVSLSLSAFYPSASLSDRVWAVARFRRWGWRAFLLLH